jgi:hypothetical protein
MKIEKIFKYFILSGGIVILLNTSSFLFETSEVLKLWDTVDMGILFVEGYETFVDIFLGTYLIVYYLCLVLLYRFVSFGKPLFIGLCVCTGILKLCLGTLVMSSVYVFIDWLDCMIQGGTLVFLYFTPIKDKFLTVKS